VVFEKPQNEFIRGLLDLKTWVHLGCILSQKIVTKTADSLTADAVFYCALVGSGGLCEGLRSGGEMGSDYSRWGTGLIVRAREGFSEKKLPDMNYNPCEQITEAKFTWGHIRKMIRGKVAAQ
jgi:hypothetical protein